MNKAKASRKRQKEAAMKRMNEFLKAENFRLLKRNEVLENGTQEMETLYRAMLTWIIMRHGHATNEGGAPYQFVVVPKDFLESIKDRELLTVSTEDGFTLRVEDSQ